MEHDHYVIIGNGPAGNRAADVLREGDPAGRITLVSGEFFPFYYRHKLRFFMAGELEEDQLVVRPPSYYKEQGIRLRLGQRVTRLDVENRTLYFKHMEKVRYTKLLLCSGGRPRLPEVHYAYQQHFTVMHSLSEARRLREQLPRLERLLIVGGDLVSVRVTETLLEQGKQVVFVIDQDSFWPLRLTDEMRGELADNLRRLGAEVIADDQICGADQVGEGYLVCTKRGAEIKCDLIGAFFGLVPDVEWLYSSGLDIDRGVLVDEHLRASAPDVYAAGDCSQVYNPAINNYWVSIGWENARQLGEVAARNVLGGDEEATTPPESALGFEGITVNTSWWRLFD